MIIEKGYDLMSIFYNNKKLSYRNRIQFILYTVIGTTKNIILYSIIHNIDCEYIAK